MSDHSLPAWIIGSFPKNADNSIEITSGNTPYSSWSVQFPIFLGGLFSFLMIAGIFAALACISSLFAILQGNIHVLWWLFWGHLPWFLMARRRRREMRRNRKAWKSDLWDEELSKRNQGNNFWVPVLFASEGPTVGYVATLPWKQFTSYEVHRQNEDHFILRLWRTDEKGLEIAPLSNFVVWPNRRSDTPLRRFARRVPLIVTVLALLAGYERFGWREDVAVALFLNLFYLCMIGLFRWIRKWSPRLVWPTATPILYLDFAFDSSKVTLEEATTRLREHLSQRGDWV